MDEEESNSSAGNNNKDSSIILTKDGQTHYVDKSGVVDGRNVVTRQESRMDDVEEESNVLDASDPRDNAASPEELNDVDDDDDDDDEEGYGDRDNVSKTCTYDGCTETTTQVAKQRKPWMCKKHRNKMYKDKYKRKKSDQALSTSKQDESLEERPVSVNKQRLGTVGDRPARPSLIEQVLNQKRLSLLRSPEVIMFLQQQQRLLATQSLSQSQPHFQGC
uniref:regulatory factor X-associated protein-like isoform X1 n=1 Tax=Oncorhynchus gorbuscha TaxID=8017 RepID=UPI001EAF0817|nr:regulatory factor X-associated protein-like isoform X1 [Oncorhynchus gorbuscha]